MIIEIIVGVIALAFVVLVVFLILALQDTRKTLKKVDRTLSDVHKTLEVVSDEGKHLMHNANKLTLGLNKKSEALDVLFNPLLSLKKADDGNGESIAVIMEYVAVGIRLFSKIREEIKHYVKSR